MNNLLKHKYKIIAGVVILIALAFTFWWGGNSSSLHGWTIDNTKHTVLTPEPTKATMALVSTTATPQATLTPTISQTPIATQPITQTATPATTSVDEYHTDPIPTGKPEPVDEPVIIPDAKQYCTLLVSCKTALDSPLLGDDIRAVLPSNGEIYYKTQVEFSKGESAFDVLKRELTSANIHLEFNFTPMYNSVYIEGINNLYEFDCGEQSGWMYKVNDWFPNYGASRYEVQSGDEISWLYTCDLGFDVGCTYISE